MLILQAKVTLSHLEIDSGNQYLNCDFPAKRQFLISIYKVKDSNTKFDSKITSNVVVCTATYPSHNAMQPYSRGELIRKYLQATKHYICLRHLSLIKSLSSAFTTVGQLRKGSLLTPRRA